MLIDSRKFYVSECQKSKDFIGKDNNFKSHCDKKITEEQYYFL